jgi:predicted nucleic acid-binding protein
MRVPGKTDRRRFGPVTVLVDAGPLYAYIDADDAHHEDSLALLASYPGPLVVPVLVLAEVAYLVGTRLGPEPEVRFLGDLAGRTFVTIPVANDDWLRMAELVARYGDLPLGTVDASIVAAAERLGVATIATLDRRHFGIVRPAHVPGFELIP